MSAPTHYFYKQAVSEEDYRNTPTHLLSISRLLQGRPYWKSAFEQGIKKNKTLIISAQELAVEDAEQKIVLIERLAQLEQEGFVLYEYLDGTLGPCTASNLDLLNSKRPKQRKATNAEVLNQAGKQLQIHTDKIQVLDDAELTKLMQGDNSDWERAQYQVMDLSCSNISGPSFEQLLIQKGSLIRELNLSRCINLRQATIPDSCDVSQLKKLTLGTLDALESGTDSYNEYAPNLSSQAINTLLRKSLLLEHLILSMKGVSSILAGINIPGLKKVSFAHSDIDGELLGDFLSGTPDLEELDLEGRKFLLIEKQLSLSKLKKLNLAGCYVPGSFFVDMLREAELDELDLDDCRSATALLEQLSLRKLKKLNLNFSRIEDSLLSRVLAQTSELEELHLGYCHSIGTIQPKLTKLKKLYLESSSSINDASIESLLSETRELEVLNLQGCSSVSTLSTRCSLSKLKTVNLRGTSLNDASLENILAEANAIEELNLAYCKNITTIPERCSLSKLKKLDFSGTAISVASLERVFAQATELEEIALTQKPIFALTKCSLSTMKKVHIERCSIGDPAFGHWLAQAGTLEELVLDECEITSAIANELSLSKLKTLGLNNTTVDGLSLANLLAEARALETLVLFKCTITSLIPKELSLSKLKKLDLSNTTIDGQSLANLLAEARALETLDLTGCTITSPLPKDLPLSKLKTVTIKDTSIDGQVLASLLAQAKPLETLDLTRCTIISPISNELPLRRLNRLIGEYATIDGSSFANLLAQASELEKLSLYKCRITSPILQKLAFSKLTEQGLKTEFIDYSTSADANYLRALWRDAFHLNSSLGFNFPSTPNHASRQQNKASKSLDADTDFDPKKIFNVTPIFYSKGAIQPEIASYRMEVFNRLLVESKPCAIGQAFTLAKAEDLKLRPCSISQSTEDLYEQLSSSSGQENQYMGRTQINLSDQWQALPSLSPNERLLSYKLHESQLKLEIQYSERDNLYYVRQQPGTPNQTLAMDFVISVPQEASLEPLPEDVQEMIATCQSFGQETLSLSVEHPTGEDYLDALMTQKVGACRHRTAVFKAWMQEHHPKLPTRIINNECHSFIEIQHQGQWRSYDLGGYPAHLNIKSSLPAPEDKQEVLIAQQERLEAHSLPQAPQEQGQSSTTVARNSQIQEKAQPIAPPRVRYFTSVREQKPHFHSHLEYAQHLVTQEQRSMLVTLPKEELLPNLRHALEAFCVKSKRPCFIINSPEDLICSSSYLSLDPSTGKGTTHKGPGGRLHEFLTQTPSPPRPVLLVNYDAFTASDIVRFNTILDEQRAADGTLIPESVQLIGLITPTKPNAYEGADFYSRFTAQQRYELNNPPLLTPPTMTSNQSDAPQVIELYEGHNWEERLLGHWMLDGHTLQFKEGLLLEALKKGHGSIQLNNPPINNPAFDAFWHSALLRKTFKVQGQEFSLPEQFSLSHHQGYSLHNTINQVMTPPLPLTAATLVVNQATLSDYLGRYELQEGNSLKHQKGLIEAHQGQTLSLYLSHELSLDNWALLLDTCQEHQVTLHLSAPPGVSVPEFLKSYVHSVEPKPQAHIRCIDTADADAWLAREGRADASCIVDVSEMTPADLFHQISATYEAEQQSFHFDEQEGLLPQLLRGDKPVVLTGQFSEELRQHLCAFLWAMPPGKQPLTLLSHNKNLVPFIQSSTQSVSSEEKKTLLLKAFPSLGVLLDQLPIEDKPLVEVQAMCRSALSQGDAFKAWEGIATLPKIDFTPLDAESFITQRMKAVEDVLKVSPFVFLSGISGVGKTSFVRGSWCNEHPAVHYGEGELLAWAEDQRPGIKTLFIDEANISSKQWSQFEGLFHQSPSIIIGNQRKKLSPEHRVIFAGNPVNYGGERQLPSFFKRHGSAVVFQPMPEDYLLKELLLPVVKDMALPDPLKLKDITQPILEVARFLTSCSQHDVLITPRELTSMALLTQSYCLEHPQADPVEVVRHYVYTLSQHHVPQEHKKEFAKQFKPAQGLPHAEEVQEVLIAENNRPVYHALLDAIQLRQHRQQNLLPKTGGLGGLVFEGDPGVGKTTLIIKTLISQGLKPQQDFLVMPVSMPLAEKEALLIKAYDQGLIVVVDELNAAPMMERLLNDLLMGIPPPGSTQLPKPGFLLLGTQNPSALPGRIKATQALNHRLQTIPITDYSFADMHKLLLQKGVDEHKALHLLEDYLIAKRSNPKLCLRDLISCAYKVLRQSNKNSILDKQQEELQIQNVESNQALSEKKAQDVLEKSEYEAHLILYEQLKSKLAQQGVPEALQQVGTVILKRVKSIIPNESVMNQISKDKREVLNSVLSLCSEALADPQSASMTKLTGLAQEVSRSTPKWQKLGKALFLFAGIVLTIACIAAAFVTGGLSLLIAGCVAAGVTSAFSANELVANKFNLDSPTFSKEQKLANSITQYKTSLQKMTNREEPHPDEPNQDNSIYPK
jgi:uncharacterized protein YjbI with pentapeptide repeats